MKKKIYLETEILELLREMCAKAGGAKPWGEKQKPKISFSYITAVLRRDAKIGAKIEKAMRIKRLPNLWVKKGDLKQVMVRFEDMMNVKD